MTTVDQPMDPAATLHEISTLQRRADRNAHGHIRHSLRLQTLNEICNYVVTIGGVTIMAASALLLGSERPNFFAEASVAAVSSIITLVGLWQVIWQPGERSRKHKEWSLKFLSVEDSCRMALVDPDNRRLEGLFQTYLLAVEQADFVPEHRWKLNREKRRIGSNLGIDNSAASNKSA